MSINRRRFLLQAPPSTILMPSSLIRCREEIYTLLRTALSAMARVLSARVLRADDDKQGNAGN